MPGKIYHSGASVETIQTSRKWSSGVLVPTVEALTGTCRRNKSLPRAYRYIDSVVGINEKEEFGDRPTPNILGNLDHLREISGQNPRCVYDYEDRFHFRRVVTGTDLLFDSHFESGNLKKAFKREIVSSSQSYEIYDLILHHDVHSVGHTQWFYFSVSNTIAGMTVKFNIGNFTKRNSLFNYGMKPLFCSKKEGNAWRRVGHNISYIPSKKKRKQYIYNLTFTHQFTSTGDVCFFSACYPYTYSDLQDHLHRLQLDQVRRGNFRRQLLCKTLGGNRCDLITITAPSASLAQIQKRPGIVITARVHPGESCASWICHGILDILTGDNQLGNKLRDAFVFKIIPMLNPDGVINGNYRTSLAGVDLNRRWDNPSSCYHPTIFATKQMVTKMLKCREILNIMDIHGHSRKEGLFMYGCKDCQCYVSSCQKSAQQIPRRIKGDNKIDVNTLPAIFDRNSPYFNLKGCNYSMQGCKSSTMRMVMYQELGITCTYTLEASLSGYNGCHFSCQDLKEMGEQYCKSLQEFGKLFCVPHSKNCNFFSICEDNTGLKISQSYFGKSKELNNDKNNEKLTRKEKIKTFYDSAGSDSNPSEDNMSEDEAIKLLSNKDMILFPSKLKTHKKRGAKIKRKKKTKKKVKKKSECTTVNVGAHLSKSSGQKTNMCTFNKTIKKSFERTQKEMKELPMVTFPLYAK